MGNSTLDVVKGLHKALESGLHGEALRELFAADASLVEYPNAITPRGATRNPTGISNASSAGAQLLAWQRIETYDCYEPFGAA